jgi:hypothetical protein
MPNITIHLDDDTHRLAKTYAARTGTSLSQLFRDHIVTVAGSDDLSNARGVLQRYARSEISSADAMNSLNLSCYEDLLSAIFAAGLNLPRLEDKIASRLAKQLVSSLREHSRA